ncbi:hypothetical protein HPB51_000466 [Rhipicephalus microplus]|uniref:Uncharacterized protein n=1 Tax=Rhipicephalus microplus TaxID=6941 RepID=A0A9J6EE96_RHIMP|nr:hypothetical protein HPB51_000466 [Rhipicephalus microplus]
MKEGRWSMTFDMWTNDHKKIAYITAMAHYVSVKWELGSLVLFTSDFSPEKKTRDNIRKEFVRRSAKLGTDEGMWSNVVFVKDQGANVIRALRPYARMNCCAHVLNTVFRYPFDNRYLAQGLPDLFEQLQKSESCCDFLQTEQTDRPATTLCVPEDMHAVEFKASLDQVRAKLGSVMSGQARAGPGLESHARAGLGLGSVMGRARATPGLKTTGTDWARAS